MVPPVKIKLYYDIVSPWSYLVLQLLLRYRQSWNLDVRLRPVFLGGIFQASGNTGPADNPYKKIYNELEMARMSQQFKVYLSPPDGFPHKTRSLNAIRLLRVIQDQYPPNILEKSTLQLYSAFFKDSIPPSSPAFFESLTTNPPIFVPSTLSQLISESQAASNKERLKIEAKKLVDEQACFGVPWIVVTRSDGKQSTFFGSDRMCAIAWWLGHEYNYYGAWPEIKRST